MYIHTYYMHLKNTPSPQGVRYVYKPHMYPYKHVCTYIEKKKQIIKSR